MRISQTAKKELSSADSLFVACSGGADSILALLFCSAFFEQQGRHVTIIVLHLNHRLRGDASDGDALFVQEACSALGIECIVGEAAWDKEIGEVREADARDQRLRFFESAVKSCGRSSATIVTGHHGDDVAETTLMRLSRGSGIQGLCAPRELSRASPRIQFLRPLLEMGREEIRQTLQNRSIPWREDASNYGEANYRSRIRKLVIPAWESVSDRPLRPGVARSRALLEEDWRALERFADSAWSEAYVATETALDRDSLLRWPAAIRRRLLARLCLEAGEGVGLSASVADEALRKLEGAEGASLDVSTIWRLEIRRKRIRLEPIGRVAAQWDKFKLPTGCRAYLPDGSRVGCELVELEQNELSAIRSGKIDDHSAIFVSAPEKHCGAVVVRRKEVGDAFKPHGKSSPQKLKSLFIDRKIAAAERLRLPVFETTAAEIVWVPGIPPAADYLLGAESRAALRLTYER